MLRCFIIFITLLSSTCFATETTTDNYLQKNINNPEKLAAFLQALPKGGDLHNHLGGASMAENLIEYGKNDQLCIDEHTYSVNAKPTCNINLRLDTAPHNLSLYNKIIDAWSMRNFQPGQESGHDHFFATFEKYYAITSHHSAEMLTEVVSHAGKQNILYLELMVTPDNNDSGMLGKKIGWNSDFAKMRDALLKNGINTIVTQISTQLTNDESVLSRALRCDNKQAQAGCDIKVRYLYQVLREQPPEQVFAQLLTGFELAEKDPRVVGINMVQAEDGMISMRDYTLHMQMIAFLHHLYPKVHISLHAGELVPGLVPAAGLRSHIRQAVEIASAERIGHGVDIAHETNANQLLNEMAKKHVMVEINLISNAAILNVKGKDHPLLLYIKHNVPIALSTDDEGVLRTSLTEQYKNALLTYSFSYPVMKNFIRNSITYSFLPGKSLWRDVDYHHVVSECEEDVVGSTSLSANCQAFIDTNEKAAMQWQLEKRFNQFEKQFSLEQK
jgi:adenosine deaminase